MATRSIIIGLSSLTLVALLTGCIHTPKGYVAREWAASIRELGIIPVFPPREDVQVGDVYLEPLSPDEQQAARAQNKPLPFGIWLQRLDLTAELNTFYSTRASFPATPTNTVDFMKGAATNPYAYLPQGTDPTRNIYLGGDTNRLRLVGFPSFMSATFNKGDLAGVVPVEAINLAFGAGFSAAKSVTVSIPAAESYGLPAGLVWSKVVTAEGKLIDLGVPSSQLHNLVNPRQAVRRVTKDGTNYFAPVRVITEVFYARALDVSVSSQKTRGLGLAARPLVTPGALTGGGTNSATGGGGNTGGTTNSGTTNTTASSSGTGTAVERAAEMNASLTQAMSQSTPGGSVKFVAAGDRGVSMRRTYERPIAVGYRALQLLVPLTQAPVGAATDRDFMPTGSGPAVLTSEGFAPAPKPSAPVDVPASQPGRK